MFKLLVLLLPFCWQFLFQSINAQRKVIAGTDMGIDDYIALNLLFEAENRKEVQILGLICVIGFAPLDTACQNLVRTLQIFNKTHIPVFKGQPRTLGGEEARLDVFGKDGMNDLHFGTGVDTSVIQKTPAATALINLLEKHPKEISVLWFAGLTDYAAAVEKNNEAIVKNIKALWVYGGDQTEVPEDNFKNDPIAADIAFSKGKYERHILTNDIAVRLSKHLDLSYTKNATNPSMRYVNVQLAVIERTMPNFVVRNAIFMAQFLDYSIVTKETRCEINVIEEGKNAGTGIFNCKKNGTYVVQDIDQQGYERVYSKINKL